MAEECVQQRLAAILAVDVVGYSRLMGANETGTPAALKAHRKELVDVKIPGHEGRIVKLAGDGMPVECSRVVNAAACATEIQRKMRERNADVPGERQIEVRIGVNVGDIIFIIFESGGHPRIRTSRRPRPAQGRLKPGARGRLQRTRLSRGRGGPGARTTSGGLDHTRFTGPASL